MVFHLCLTIILVYSIHHTRSQTPSSLLQQSSSIAPNILPVLSLKPLDEKDDRDKYIPAPPRQQLPRKLDNDRVIQGMKDMEYAAVLNLTLDRDVTHRTIKTGNWSDSSIWSSGAVPDNDSCVVIDAGHKVTVSSELDNVTLKWVRVDGLLTMKAENANLALKFVTMVVSGDGKLEVGTKEARINPDITARLVMAPRGARDEETDPYDFFGGLIVAGKLSLFGAEKKGHAIPKEDLKTGTSVLSFDEAPLGWRVGDRLLFPGLFPSHKVNQDEIRKVTSISDDGRKIEIETPLRFDHLSPPEEQKHLVPVGNLDRNIVVTSEKHVPLSTRGHFMVLHRQTDVDIDSASFVELGRTNGLHAHTDPMGEHGSNHNTMGRYPLHFHIRGVASIDIPPITVYHSVIEGGPKYGLVNHGGHVEAVDNVSYQVRSAHFFTENGSEIGTFRGNLAVRSPGTEEYTKSRMWVYDFGHGGNGFWMTGGGVTVVDNYAFGHRQPAFIFFTQGARECGRTAYIKTDSIQTLKGKTEGLAKFLHTDAAPFFFSNNVAAGCERGVEVWYHNRFSPHAEVSVIEDSVFWNHWQVAAFPLRALSGDITVPYSKNIKIQNVRLYGDGTLRDKKGIWGNDETESIVMENLRVLGFESGVYVPRLGTNVVRNSTFSCKKSIYIQNPTVPERTITLDGNEFLEFDHFPHLEKHNIYLEDNVEIPIPVIYAGDESVQFGSDIILYDDKQVFYKSQMQDADLANITGLPVFDGRTSGQVWDQFKYAVGGALAPKSATFDANVPNGFVGTKVDMQPRKLELASSRLSCAISEYKPVVRTLDGRILEGEPIHLSPGWNLLYTNTAEFKESFLVYGSHGNAPSFDFDPGTSFQIHPDDVKIGFFLAGNIISKVDGAEVKVKVAEIIPLPQNHNNKTIHIDVPIEGKGGCKSELELTLHINDKAPKRSLNVNSFEQVALLDYAK